MTTQRVLWTACPHGKATDGKLRISVHVGPQLFPTSNAVSVLSEFPDWARWPSTAVSFKVKVGTGVHDATIVSTRPSLSLWEALFAPSTPVEPYEYSSPTSSPLYSYPAGFVRQFFQSTYGALADTAPLGAWPSMQLLTSDLSLGRLPINARDLAYEIDRVMALFPKGGGPIPPGTSPDPGTDLTQAYLFLQPLTVPAPNQTYADTPPPLVPEFDFHRAVSLLGRHPALLRLFGLVYELELTRPGGLPPIAPVSVLPSWKPKLKNIGGLDRTTDVKPVTMTNTGEWIPAHRTVNPEIAAGFLRLSDPDYEVVEMDLDGATLKAFNFVQGIEYANTTMASADTPTHYAVPSLRSAGLALAKTGNALSLYQNWQNNDTFNSAIEASPPAPVELYFEDMAQGCRVDVWSKSRNRWFPLCARTAAKHPGLGGYGIGSPPTVVPVPSGDEGWVEPATTQSASSTGPNPPVYVPEYLMRWAGWSLAAARPGKHLSDIPSDGLDPDTANPADGNLPLRIDYAAVPGTLPVLRFGATYRFRARAVDLAGNSVPFSESGVFTWATKEVTYRRFEPVPSPVLIPTAPRTPGEHLENLVIRSNYDIPDDDPSIVACERHIAPASTGEDMAETHGVLDGPDGHPDPSSYALIADRDGLTYKTHSVRNLYGGKIDKQPLNGKNEWIYYPPGAAATAFGVPYLPDVLSRGVSLFNLPGKKGGVVRAPFDSIGAWPTRRAVRLVVNAGVGAPDVPASADLDGAIVVKAPKASITSVLISSYIEPADLELMALWAWLVDLGRATPALKALIIDRFHYMFTPYRELVIVHAVRQPLTPPALEKLIRTRPYGGTYALLSGLLRANVQSTVRVDVLAAWADPYDDGISKQGAILLEKTSRVDEIPLSLGQSNVIVLDKIRHDFGDTQHHEVFYSATATTRFLEYFTEVVTKKLPGTAAVVCSPGGFAPGTLDVRAAGDTATIYKSGVDFTEDDKAGSIARVATGSIPNDASVSVQFVAPPVIRSSLEKDAKPPTKLGYLLSIPSTARPPAPDVRYLIPAWNWVNVSSATSPSSSRVGNVLRVYLGRPWFASGIGELLGVVVASPPGGGVLPAGLQPFVSGFGSDPVFATGPVGTPRVTDFGLATHKGTGLLLEEQTGVVPWVDVAGHEVGWDEERRLWFADISIGAGQSYFPFAKLALVRYQPGSLPGIELSRVVQADFIQLAPNRSMGLTYPSATEVNVEVLGPGFFATSPSGSTTVAGVPDTMRAYLQLKTVETSDPDLQWIIDPAQPDGVVLAVSSSSETLTIWKGSIKLPKPRGSVPYRILVAEFEEHTVVRAGNLAAKVTYLDAIEI
ncbi:MAG: hypothetical protein ABSG36_02030 [Acidimicrobiales bacterium]